MMFPRKYWQKITDRPDELVYANKYTESSYLKAWRSGDKGTKWFASSHFGNYHFPVPGLKVLRFGPFRSKREAKAFMLRWMKRHKRGGSHPFVEKSEARAS